MEWSELSRDCVYRLDHVDAVNQIMYLTDRKRVKKSARIPTFVIDKLYDEVTDVPEDINTTIYFRPKGEDSIDIVSKIKYYFRRKL